MNANLASGFPSLPHGTASTAPRLRGRMPTDPRLPLAAARDRLLRAAPAPAEPVKQAGPGRVTTAQRQALYLTAYSASGNVRIAAAHAGVSRSTVYRWRQHSAPFRMREALAEADYLDALRAQVDTRSQESDAILMLRARCLLPEYRETIRQEHVMRERCPTRFTLQIGAVPPEGDP